MSLAEPMGASEGPEFDARPKVTREAAAEAAVWVARLHGPSRSPRMERECREWQSRSAENREAFERCTQTWEDLAGLTVSGAYAAADASQARSPSPRRWVPALALAVLAGVGVVLVQQWRNVGVYRTAVGEQQRVLLDDGTRLTLNTDTRLDMALGRTERVATLDHGEALFEVAKDPRRPFVVRVAGANVVAHGTTFAVRVTPSDGSAGPGVAVTLLDGQVSVEPDAEQALGTATPSQTRMMQPGDRVRLVPAAGKGPPVVQVDRPNVENIVAWQRNEVVFDDVSLVNAVAEMNRYSRTTIVLLEPAALGPLRVSGLFRVGDSVGFARAVAALHGLRLDDQQGRLELAKPQ